MTQISFPSCQNLIGPCPRPIMAHLCHYTSVFTCEQGVHVLHPFSLLPPVPISRLILLPPEAPIPLPHSILVPVDLRLVRGLSDDHVLLVLGEALLVLDHLVGAGTLALVLDLLLILGLVSCLLPVPGEGALLSAVSSPPGPFS